MAALQSSASSSPGSSSGGSSRLTHALLFKFVAFLATFYAGILTERHTGFSSDWGHLALPETSVNIPDHPLLQTVDITKDARFESMVQKRVEEVLAQLNTANKTVNKRNSSKEEHGNDRIRPFGTELSRSVVGAVRISKEDFLTQYDYGYPYDGVQNEVLLLYNKESALPDTTKAVETGVVPELSAADATANCDALHVVSTGQSEQCLAIVGQQVHTSFHVQNWMRRSPKGGGQVQHDLPLVPMRRDALDVPRDALISKGWTWIKEYAANVQAYQEQLKALLKDVAVNNAVVVMVCNFGQVDLLMNFCCAAKAKGLDISNALVFATDQDTKEVATALGLAVFYDESTFKGFSSKEAKVYGDGIFADLMVAKVEVVQLVNSLGYDVLFQDVDIVWYKNPLPLFQDEQSSLVDYDMIFQDTAIRNEKFKPYYANSGFYYVRNNAKTRYLLTSLLRSADLIWNTRSHQQVLATFLSEHASLFNLRVKTLKGDDFPSGSHYHRAPNLMHSIVEGKHKPWLFHMNWTTNKDNKLLFLKQMGLWYVMPQCEGHGAKDVLEKQMGGSASYESSCCAAEPLVTCHYKDKPSIIPCNDSPTLDKNKDKTFWENK